MIQFFEVKEFIITFNIFIPKADHFYIKVLYINNKLIIIVTKRYTSYNKVNNSY